MSYFINADLLAENFVPPSKRMPKILAYIKALISPMKVNFENTANAFLYGDSSLDYSNVVSYVYGDIVKYNKSVYLCIDNSIGVSPIDRNKWVLIQDKFTGILKRAKYNGQKLSYEFMLNEWFETQFRQPPLVSDIYITDNVIDNFFLVGIDDFNSGYIGISDSSSFLVGADNPVYSSSNFTINIPISVSNSLTNEVGDVVPNISTNRERIIRQIADIYKFAGINYNIKTY